MYSPKIKKDLVPYLYQIAKRQRKPMTKIVDEMLREQVIKLYDAESEAKKEDAFWDRIARSPHESYEQEGIMINRAQAEGKIIAFKRVIEMFERQKKTAYITYTSWA